MSRRGADCWHERTPLAPSRCRGCGRPAAGPGRPCPAPPRRAAPARHLAVGAAAQPAAAGAVGGGAAGRRAAVEPRLRLRGCGPAAAGARRHPVRHLLHLQGVHGQRGDAPGRAGPLRAGRRHGAPAARRRPARGRRRARRAHRAQPAHAQQRPGARGGLSLLGAAGLQLPHAGAAARHAARGAERAAPAPALQQPRHRPAR